MDLKNPRDLDKLLTVCRKKGVQTIKISQDSIEITLAPELPKKQRAAAVSSISEESLPFGPEDALFWSSPQATDIGAA